MPPKSKPTPSTTSPGYRDVKTTDAPEHETLKFNRSASLWTKQDLELLGVDYRIKEVEDIESGINHGDTPKELLQSTTRSHDLTED